MAPTANTHKRHKDTEHIFPYAGAELARYLSWLATGGGTDSGVVQPGGALPAGSTLYGCGRCKVCVDPLALDQVRTASLTLDQVRTPSSSSPTHTYSHPPPLLPRPPAPRLAPPPSLEVRVQVRSAELPVQANAS